MSKSYARGFFFIFVGLAPNLARIETPGSDGITGHGLKTERGSGLEVRSVEKKRWYDSQK